MFKDSIQSAQTNCYMLSSVKRIRKLITSEVVEAGGNALRGLWNHLCMNKGAGLPHVLASSKLGDMDISSIQTYFRNKIGESKRNLSKSQIQAAEVWAFEVFKDMPRDDKGQFPVMEYLKELSLYFNEYYVESRNALLRTEKELGIINEEEINPTAATVQDIENTLAQTGFRDKEDLYHIASCAWLKQNRGYVPIFATADRDLYMIKDFVFESTGVIIEDALYALGTYRSLLTPSWPVSRVKE